MNENKTYEHAGEVIKAIQEEYAKGVIKDYEMPPLVNMKTGETIGFAVAAMMFADGEKMKRQMQEVEEERPYLEEINRIDAQFDNEIIRMSGFEW